MQPVVRPVVLAWVGLSGLALLLSGCSGQSTGDEPVRLTVWQHAGTPAETSTLARQVRDFEASHPAISVRIHRVTEGDYNDQLQIASAAGHLPDVLEIDGPHLASYVYQRRLQPLDHLLPAATLADQLPSVRSQDTTAGHAYAVATFDSGLGIFADRSQLTAAGVTWPHGYADAWTGRQFTHALARLAAHDADGKVLDVKRSYGVGEWLTYGFAPLVASAGGELVDPVSLRARGHLDGRPAERALGFVAHLAPYVDPDPDDDAFVHRRVALSWVGHWDYPAYAKALGRDLLVLPLPDLGHGAKTGQGSWAWSVSAQSPHATAAASFLAFLVRDRQVLAMTRANGAVPATRTALARSPQFARGGALHLYAEQLLHSCGTSRPTRSCVAVPRPVTPDYPLVSARFADAVEQALEGHDADAALHAGARASDADLAADHFFR